MVIDNGLSQMFAQAKLADLENRVKPDALRQRGTGVARIGITQPWASGRVQHNPDDLNYSNRPVRTRMPGGVGGARSGILTAPIPIAQLTGTFALMDCLNAFQSI